MGPQGQCHHPSLPGGGGGLWGRAGEEGVEGHVIRGLPTATQRDLWGGAEA